MNQDKCPSFSASDAKESSHGWAGWKHWPVRQLDDKSYGRFRLCSWCGWEEKEPIETYDEEKGKFMQECYLKEVQGTPFSRRVLGVWKDNEYLGKDWDDSWYKKTYGL